MRTAMLTVLASAPAAPIKCAAAGLQLKLPKGWKSMQQEQVVSAETADGSLAVICMEVKDLSMDDLKALKKNPKAVLKQLDLMTGVAVDEEPSEEKVNGLKQTAFTGTGKLKESKKEVSWSLTVVEGGKLPVFVIAVGNLDDNEDDLDELLGSIRKAKDE